MECTVAVRLSLYEDADARSLASHYSKHNGQSLVIQRGTKGVLNGEACTSQRKGLSVYTGLA